MLRTLPRTPTPLRPSRLIPGEPTCDVLSPWHYLNTCWHQNQGHGHLAIPRRAGGQDTRPRWQPRGPEAPFPPCFSQAQDGHGQTSTAGCSLPQGQGSFFPLSCAEKDKLIPSGQPGNPHHSFDFRLLLNGVGAELLTCFSLLIPCSTSGHGRQQSPSLGTAGAFCSLTAGSKAPDTVKFGWAT